MDYMSTHEAAQIWGVTPRQVQRLLHEKRIPGAKKSGPAWLIPIDADKPADPRRPLENLARFGEEYPVAPLQYLHEGDLVGARARCSTPEARALFEGSLAFYRGEPEAARALVQPLYDTARDPRLKLGCGVMLALCAMSLGDVGAWSDIRATLSALSFPPYMRMYPEIAVAALNAGMHGRDVYPEWLEWGAFGELDPMLYPVARWVYAKLLYVKWKEIELLAVIEPLIAECHRERSDLFETYLHLLAAIVCHDHGKKARAKEHINKAADIALPLGIIQPFIEYRRLLLSPMDACLRARYPLALAAIRKRTTPFMDNWLKLYNSLWDHPMDTVLTPREYEVCRLIHRGMLVDEIARRMGIARASVRKYLNAAYHKLGIEGKSELDKFIHT